MLDDVLFFIFTKDIPDNIKSEAVEEIKRMVNDKEYGKYVNYTVDAIDVMSLCAWVYTNKGEDFWNLIHTAPKILIRIGSMRDYFIEDKIDTALKYIGSNNSQSQSSDKNKTLRRIVEII